VQNRQSTTYLESFRLVVSRVDGVLALARVGRQLPTVDSDRVQEKNAALADVIGAVLPLYRGTWAVRVGSWSLLLAMFSGRMCKSGWVLRTVCDGTVVRGLEEAIGSEGVGYARVSRFK
jgi:hypothetical protein